MDSSDKPRKLHWSNNVEYLLRKGFESAKHDSGRIIFDLRTESEVIRIRLGAKGGVSGTLSSGMLLSREHVPELETMLRTEEVQWKQLEDRMQKHVAGTGVCIQRDGKTMPYEPISKYVMSANGESAEEVYDVLMQAYDILKQVLKLEPRSKLTDMLPPGIIIAKGKPNEEVIITSVFND